MFVCVWVGGLQYMLSQCRWLLAHGRQQEGRAALGKLTVSADVDKEVADISAQVDTDRAARVSVWAALGTPELRAQLHIGIVSCLIKSSYDLLSKLVRSS